MGLEKKGAPEISPELYDRDQHNISRDNIDPDALKIMYRLLQHGYKAFLVGGAVRDLLMNKKPKDYDIGTNATPREIKEIFRNSRIIGRRFKLVHIFFKGNKIIEVSTFRDTSDQEEESGEENSQASAILRDNRYGTEATDALRRDITINGLFYDLSSFAIIDYVGGMHDLHHGVIKVIGQPDVRFAEDPVRMLRVVRHAVRSGFVIDDDTWDSLIRNKELICDVTAVRVYEEIKKDLCCGYSLEILRLLGKTGLLGCLLPELMQRDGALLLPGSHFSRSLAKSDQIILSGETVSPTVVLSAIALFVANPELEVSELRHVFRDLAHLHDHLRECFLELAVPKKERERIEQILAEWLYLSLTPENKIKPSTYARKPFLDDLITFLNVLTPGSAEHPLAKMLGKIRETRRHGDDDDDDTSNRAMRRRRGGHGGGQARGHRSHRARRIF